MKFDHNWSNFKTDEERRYADLRYAPTEAGKCMERNEKLKTSSQNLRKNATKEENLLWYNFLRGYKPQFRRQYVIGNYIVDFYCHKAKLVVELDGSQHCDPYEIAYDRVRTSYLQSQGLLVIRISNLDLLREFANVCEYLDAIIKTRVSAT